MKIWSENFGAKKKREKWKVTSKKEVNRSKDVEVCEKRESGNTLTLIKEYGSLLKLSTEGLNVGCSKNVNCLINGTQ